jgi:hypothetical protein
VGAAQGEGWGSARAPRRWPRLRGWPA